jgi:hypothetical protein
MVRDAQTHVADYPSIGVVPTDDEIAASAHRFLHELAEPCLVGGQLV